MMTSDGVCPPRALVSGPAFQQAQVHDCAVASCPPFGERRRKSVRGCIVSSDLSVLNLVIVKKGEQELPGLTDEEKPRMRGPKRASKIRKLFNLSKVRLLPC
eukprot:scaffold51766_cov14-Tisochrysis_lutea.AAC.2